MSAQVTEVDVPAAGDTGGIGQAVRDYIARVRGGDIGSLPAVLGLIALVILFGILEGGTFLSIFNFANLINQSAAIIVLAMGLVFVLLLGEIDLSAGFAAGTAAAVLAVVLTNMGMAWPIALLAALLTGVVIGLTIGLLVARLGIPSFVVTLAMFLALQGAMLLIIGEGGTIPIRDDAILVIMNGNMPVIAGWVLAAVVVGGFAFINLMAISRRRKAGLPAESMSGQPRSSLLQCWSSWRPTSSTKNVSSRRPTSSFRAFPGLLSSSLLCWSSSRSSCSALDLVVTSTPWVAIVRRPVVRASTSRA